MRCRTNGGAEGKEAEDEIDPLDAFMAENKLKTVDDAGDSKIAKSTSGEQAEFKPKEEEEEDEIDPLDAFMATNIAPEVERLNKENQTVNDSEAEMKEAEEDEKGVEAGYDADNADNGAPTVKMKLQVRKQKKFQKNKRRSRALQERR